MQVEGKNVLVLGAPAWSGHLSAGTFWSTGQHCWRWRPGKDFFDHGEIVSWIFIHEDGGHREKN